MWYCFLFNNVRQKKDFCWRDHHLLNIMFEFFYTCVNMKCLSFQVFFFVTTIFLFFLLRKVALRSFPLFRLNLLQEPCVCYNGYFPRMSIMEKVFSTFKFLGRPLFKFIVNNNSIQKQMESYHYYILLLSICR